MKTPKLAVVLLVVCWLSASAKDKHLPLPLRVLSAKTVYIDNQSGQAAIGDRAYQEITAWGRFQVVQDRRQADLVMLLSSREESGGSRQTGTVDEDGNIYTRSRPILRQFSGLAVLDARTGETLWTESREAAAFRKSAIKRAIDELRKRIEEQAAERHEP